MLYKLYQLLYVNYISKKYMICLVGRKKYEYVWNRVGVNKEERNRVNENI